MTEFNIFIATIVGIISFTIGAVRVIRMLIDNHHDRTEIENLKQICNSLENRFESNFLKFERKMERYEDASIHGLGDIIEELIGELKK